MSGRSYVFRVFGLSVSRVWPVYAVSVKFVSVGPGWLLSLSSEALYALPWAVLLSLLELPFPLIVCAVPRRRHSSEIRDSRLPRANADLVPFCLVAGRQAFQACDGTGAGRSISVKLLLEQRHQLSSPLRLFLAVVTRSDVLTMYVCILICMCNRILFPRLAHHEDNGHTRTDPVTAACLVHQVRRSARGTVPARDRPDDQPHRSHTTPRHNKSRRVCTQTHHAETRAHFPTAGATDTVHVHVHVHVDATCQYTLWARFRARHPGAIAIREYESKST